MAEKKNTKNTKKTPADTAGEERFVASGKGIVVTKRPPKTPAKKGK